MVDHAFLKKYHLQARGFAKIGGVVKITTPDACYILKKRSNSMCYRYLRSRNFPYLPKIYNENSDDPWDIMEYIPSVELRDSEKLGDLMGMLSLLHMKTTSYRMVSLDDIKILYEKIKKELSEAKVFYEEYFSLVRSEVFMSPDHYLFARNSSELKSLFLFCDQELENWYDMMKHKKKERICFIHNHLSLDHFLVNENRYFISWDRARMDLPIYDLISLYRQYYRVTDFRELLLIYENRYPLSREEKSLFFLLISIPKKLDFTNCSYTNTLLVKEFFDYIDQTNTFLSPYYANEQKKENK